MMDDANTSRRLHTPREAILMPPLVTIVAVLALVRTIERDSNINSDMKPPEHE